VTSKKKVIYPLILSYVEFKQFPSVVAQK
jgi:hypothetical protein